MSEEFANKPDAGQPASEPASAAANAPVLIKKKEKDEKPEKNRGKEAKHLKLLSPEAQAAAEEERTKIIHIFQRLEEENAQWRTRHRRAPWMLISVLAVIMLPTLIAAIYYYGIAADRYIAEARFAIRSNDSGGAASALGGLLSGGGGTPSFSDSYMVTDYITSREMVRLLDEQVGLREIYSDERADFLTKLDPSVPLEGLVSYWNKRVQVQYDPAKTTISLQVQAFAPEAAAQIVVAVLDNARELVNGISANARRDGLKFASQELARAELKLRAARQDVLDFRLANNSLDPMVSAESTLELAANLEAERTQLSAQLSSLSGYLSDEAPSLQVMKARLGALQKEIDRLQEQISQDPSPRSASADGGPLVEGEYSGAMAETVGRYQELQASQLLAEKAYASALTSMEHARAEAERTQSYLAVYLPPTPTDAAAFPRRGVNILIVLVLACVLWIVGQLAVATVRDHMA